MKQPKVSIIIPTLSGRIKHLQKALSSIEKQTYKNTETIIVREGNSASEARNIGIDRANGKYIAFLDDDDICYPQRIELQVQEAEENPNAGLIFCWIQDKRFGKEYTDNYKKEINLNDALKLMRLSSTSSYFVRKDLLTKVGNFDTTFPSAQEYELAIRLLKETDKAICINKILVTQNQSEGQITKDWDKKIKGLQQLLKKHKSLYKKLGFIEYGKIRIKFILAITLYRFAGIFGEGIYKVIIPIKRRTGNE